MEKIVKYTGILIGFLLVMGIILGTLVLNLMKENTKCTNNPFIYGAVRYYENNAPITCVCTSLNPKYKGFVFDNESMRNLDQEKQVNFTLG